jgi:hypothetical protein
MHWIRSLLRFAEMQHVGKKYLTLVYCECIQICSELFFTY